MKKTEKGRKQTQHTWRAGVAEIDISPPLGVQLVGYPTVIRPSTGVHDPLYADCLVLDDGVTRIALLTADLVYFEKALVARVRRAVAAATDIPADHLLMSCSHTHAGPRMGTRLFDEEIAMGGRVEHEYLRDLERRLVELVVRAASSLQEARVGFGRGAAGSELGIGGNRHDPDGPADPAVRLLGVRSPEGRWLAALVKYSLHPTILQMDNTLASADYPFGIRRTLTGLHPDLTVLFAQGATGDQSSRYFRKEQSFAEAERFGNTIGGEAGRVLAGMRCEAPPRLGVRSTQVEPVWKELPAVEELEQRVEEYWRQLHELEGRGAPYVERQTCYLDRLGTEFTLSFARLRAQGRKAPWAYEVPLEVQAVRVGDACLVGVAGEIFVRYTLEMERRSPFEHTFVISLANGMAPGYMVDRESAEKRLFEAGASMLSPETGERIVEAGGRLCRELYQEDSNG
jgi:neutral ceramidase